MKAITAMDLPARSGTFYPEPFRSRVLPRDKRALGDAFGLTKIGVNLTVLHPGVESSMRHWHDCEDELVYVLEGELVLVSDSGEQTLSAGMVVGCRAGDSDAHQLVNRSRRAAVYLEIANRDAADAAFYPDIDMACGKDAQGRFVFTHKDGTPY
ncbi:MAG: cupin domain-containing protein [Proteobacteria bacterium]|nr:cupin domain-containing protein [Pseudomonadota bacterium]